MDKHKKNTNPTTKHLRRYVKGELSAMEQHQVEEIALKNQQIDDTIEGLTALKAAQIDEKGALKELRQKVRRRIEKKEKRWLPYYYASAAAVVLAVGLGWWVVQREEEADRALSPSMMLEKAQPSPSLEEQSPVIAQKILPESSDKKTTRKNAHPKQATNELVVEEIIISTGEGDDPNAKMVQAPAQVAEVPQNTDEGKAKLANSERIAAKAAPPPPTGNFLRRQQVFSIIKDSAVAPVASAEGQRLTDESQSLTVAPNHTIFPISWKNYEHYVATSASTFITQHPEAPRGRVVLDFKKDSTGRFVEFENKNKADTLLFKEAVRIVKSGETWNVPLKEKDTKRGKVRMVINFKK